MILRSTPEERVITAQVLSDGSKLTGPTSYFPSIERTYGVPVQDWLDVANERLDYEPHMKVVAWLK